MQQEVNYWRMMRWLRMGDDAGREGVGEREKIKSHLRLRDVDERPKLRQQNVIIQGEIPLLEQTLSKLKVSFWCWCGCCRSCCCCVYFILIARLFVFSSFCGLFLSASSLLLLLLPFLACCQCETSKSWDSIKVPFFHCNVWWSLSLTVFLLFICVPLLALFRACPCFNFFLNLRKIKRSIERGRDGDIIQLFSGLAKRNLNNEKKNFLAIHPYPWELCFFPPLMDCCRYAFLAYPISFPVHILPSKLSIDVDPIAFWFS